MSDYRQSTEFLDRKYFGNLLRRRSDHLGLEAKALMRVIVNLWFHHRHGQGVINPGRESLGKRCEAALSVRTVSRYLGEFRRLGFITPVQYAKGGRKSTRYTVDLERISRVLDPGAWKVVTAPGQLIEIAADFCRKPIGRIGMHIRKKPGQCVPRYKGYVPDFQGYQLTRLRVLFWKAMRLVRPSPAQPREGPASWDISWFDDRYSRAAA